MFNTLRPRQNGRYFADDIFKCMYLNDNVWSLIKMSPMFVPEGPINNIPALVKKVAYYRNQWWLDYQRIYILFLYECLFSDDKHLTHLLIIRSEIKTYKNQLVSKFNW